MHRFLSKRDCECILCSVHWSMFVTWKVLRKGLGPGKPWNIGFYEIFKFRKNSFCKITIVTAKFSNSKVNCCLWDEEFVGTWRR